MSTVFTPLQSRRSFEEAISKSHMRSASGDERFHISVARATSNAAIVEIMRGILRKLAIAWDMDCRLPLDPERDLEMHRRTLAALMSRDPMEIVAVMDDHLRILEHLWEAE